MLDYQLIRSKRRKTLGLQVKHGQVTVRAPYYVTAAFIDTFIQEKSAWLRAKVTEQQRQVDCCDFSHGSNILFLGDKYVVNVSLAKQATVFISNGLANNDLSSNTELSALQSLCSQQPHFQEPIKKSISVVISERVHAKLAAPLAMEKQVKKQLESYFKQQAELLINERLELISKKTSLTPIKVNIRQYKARWGSCNNRGEVSFNYLLMMSPPFVIDYVIFHELCHLEYLDHSKNFWELVERHCPNFQVAKKWLTSNQSQLHWMNPTKS
jgi:predicted metal-dependent hydrolase